MAILYEASAQIQTKDFPILNSGFSNHSLFEGGPLTYAIGSLPTKLSTAPMRDLPQPHGLENFGLRFLTRGLLLNPPPYVNPSVQIIKGTHPINHMIPDHQCESRGEAKHIRGPRWVSSDLLYQGRSPPIIWDWHLIVPCETFAFAQPILPGTSNNQTWLNLEGIEGEEENPNRVRRLPMFCTVSQYSSRTKPQTLKEAGRLEGNLTLTLLI